MATAKVRRRTLAQWLNLPIRDPRLDEVDEIRHCFYMPALAIQGVYGILDIEHGEIYIGSSKDCHRRETQHDRMLRQQNHHCLSLQDICEAIDNQRWRFILLEEVENNFNLTERERWWRYRVRDCIDLDNYRRNRDAR